MSDAPVGTVLALPPGAEAPPDYLLCDGAILSCYLHKALFKVIRYAYGGRRRDREFGVPDMNVVGGRIHAVKFR